MLGFVRGAGLSYLVAGLIRHLVKLNMRYPQSLERCRGYISLEENPGSITITVSAVKVE